MVKGSVWSDWGVPMLVTAVFSVVVLGGAFAWRWWKTPQTVTYSLGGTTDAANVVYTDSNGGIQEANGVFVGTWSMTVTRHRGAMVVLTAQNEEGSGTLECRVEVGGKVVRIGRASGGYAIASCTASVP